MQIIEQHLPKGQYMEEEHTKRNIVLHHTVSSTAKSALDWWAIDPQRIATAYVVDKAGNIYEAFPPQFWAHHLGLREARNLQLNQQSIGIEIVNEGPLTYQPHNGGWRWFVSAQRATGLPYDGPVHRQVWRGQLTWATYTEAQYSAVNELCEHLCLKFGIPRTVCASRDLVPNAPDKFGVYAHFHVRRDQTDPSPAFDLSRVLAQPKAL